LYDSIGNPLALILIALVGMCLFIVEKGEAYTARDAVVVGCFFEKHLGLPRFENRITL
jgi:hypothetical protein